MRIYCTVINEVSRKYDTTRDFINKRLNELCSEHGISAEEVRLYYFLPFIEVSCYMLEIFYSSVSYQLESFFVKIVKDLRLLNILQNIFITHE